ncbi:MAG: polyheme membrane-associated cytochrome C [Candidatus Bipolaricaulia bacterium]
MVKTKLAILLAAVLCLGVFTAFAAEPQEAWEGSPHADRESEGFAHWDEDDPAVVPAGCAKCHAGDGFLDFLGEDGTEAGVVDNDAEPGVITCDSCHNDSVDALDSVTFESGVTVDVVSEEAPCVQCHQGRSYGGAVDAAAEGVDADAVIEGQRFINVHYAPAGATREGSVANVGYEYAGLEYVGSFAHATGFDACAKCHDSHSLELLMDACICHPGVTDPGAIRMGGDDYDGDGDVAEGVKYEIETLHGALLAALEALGPVYNADRYPYWFDAAGESFAAWTPRLLKAAYNYQLVAKEAGFYTHNPKYAIQLLIDSLADLGADVSGYARP